MTKSPGAVVAAEAATSDARPRRRRRRRGSGRIHFVREGVYRVDIELKRDPVTGKRRRISRQIEGRYDDAEVALARLRVADHEGRLTARGTRARSVRAVLEAYIKDIELERIEMAPKTLVTSRSAMNTMCRTQLPDGRIFGDIRLSQFNWQDVEELYRAMKRDGKGAAWIRRCATVLSQALERARKHGLIDFNPEKDAARPKTVRPKPVSPRKEEVVDLVADAERKDEELADLLRVLAGTGVRLGEVLAWWWEDVSLAARYAHTAAAVTDGGPGVGIIRKETKKSDWRDVPLTDGVVRALQRQLERRRAILGRDPGPDEYVFPGSANGRRPHRPDSMGDRLAAARGAVPTTFLHLRHFAATTMLDAGEAYRTVAEILGNSETTLRLHYDGRTNIDKRKAVSALELD